MARKGNISGLFVAFEIKDMNSIAFRRLSKPSQLAIFFLDKFYWESDRRNPIPMPQKWFAGLLNCTPATAQKILTELDDYGFIERTHKGGLKGPTDRRSSCYKLTWRPDNEGGKPTRNWRTQSKQIAKTFK